jgi:hypothetical protein
MLDQSKVRDRMKGPQDCEVRRLGTRDIGVRLPTSPGNGMYVEKSSDGCPINKLEDSRPHKRADKIVISYILIFILFYFIFFLFLFF